MRRRLAVLATILTIPAALAGCGSSSSTKTVTQTAASPATATQSAATPSTSTISKAQAAHDYLAAIAPFKATDTTVVAEINAQPDSAGAATFAKIATPLAQALTNVRPGLLAIGNAYPPAASDIKGLVTASAPVIGDVDNIGTLTAFNASSWEQQLASDASAMTAAAVIVRSDLGLPATTS